ncbi:aminotransferase class III-fold pyridoxal phosphate-dependent enzyme [Streptomyces triticirhizae]|uniref:Aminotransferase class III-fold pyridoxal phosphate-dependent enzyme n=1 Tax=Streptomyces triticirhizae TaxID=2483353 RepID=A0A3M2LKB0_9ACTN|nr:aminotransferase class III-fold pyridoxal phosphate-dependent enzyme [Streptomyces triticirhizae]RMI37240.1 aminotransferase class III-fold pyridoxal phosphate-dependent enzyme [Streptomyces triticirhizae]
MVTTNVTDLITSADAEAQAVPNEPTPEQPGGGPKAAPGGAPDTAHGAAPRTAEEKRAELRRRLQALASRDATAERYRRHVNPHIARTLDGLGIDVSFTRGEGTRLYDAEGNRYLDFAGAYGALPFGHNPPRIWEAIVQVGETLEPSLTQPSVLGAAALLAERLAGVAPAGLDQVWMCNSGAEAVEASIKLARAATGRPLIVATRNAFHGKTLGALSATGRPRYQTPFGAPVGGFTHVPFNDSEALAAVFAEHGDDIAGFIVETVQGEGGIHPATHGFLRMARELCTQHGARLIIDEVQTGLGRTGRLFGHEHSGVVPDIMPLAKALGGGVVPAGAVLFGESSLSEDFGLRHTSTFGGNAFCARVSIRALELLTENDQALVRQVAERASYLREGLEAVAAAHPRLVTGVRGQGLLLGVELTTDPDVFPRQGLFRSLADQEGLAGFLCGYLLRNEGIRLAPTYFSNSVLRIEPPLTVSEEECAALLEALERGLDVIEAGDSGRFFRHLLPAGEREAAERAAERAAAEAPEREPAAPAEPADEPLRPRPDEPRWAFVAHPTDLASYAAYDARLGLPGEQVRVLFDRMNQCRNVDTPAAMFVGAVRVHTDTGETSYGEIFALPYGAARLLDMPAGQATEIVQQAVDQAVERGAQLVGLGAYTSVVTGNAEALDDHGVPITTGNAYTVAAGVDGLERAAALQGRALAGAGVVVLGAAGAIGRASSLLLAERVGRLVLVGNPANRLRSEVRLAEVAAAVVGHLAERGRREDSGELALAVLERTERGLGPERVVAELADAGLLTTSLEAERELPGAHLVLAATSTPDQIIKPDLLHERAVICDVSQPPNVGPEVRERRPDVLVVAGGLVRMPGGRDLGVDFGVPRGVTYACTAETMIAAHRLADPVVSHGERLSGELVRTLREDAARLGFRLHLPERPTVPDTPHATATATETEEGGNA